MYVVRLPAHIFLSIIEKILPKVVMAAENLFKSPQTSSLNKLQR